MKTLDLFEDWTPEMLASMKDGRAKGGRTGTINSKEHNRRMSEALTGRSLSKETRRRMSEAHTGMTHSEESRRKMSEAQMGNTNRLGKFHSEETKREISEGNIGKTFSNETIRKMSEAHMGVPKGPHSVETIRKMSETKMGHTVSEAARKQISETLRGNWERIPQEEKDRIIRNSLNSDEAIRRRIEALHIRPNELEKWVGWKLDKKFPGEWAYNGDYSQGITIGRRIPDFVNINGKKEVISVMGGLGICHFLEDEQKEIDHYAKYGYKCTVIWEWDAYDPEELDKILGI